MTHRRLRDLCAAAVACAALAMAPASAGAHPGDGQCPITAGATTPTAGWFAGSGGCADAAVAAPGAGDSVAPRPKAVLASYTPEAAEAEPPGAFAQVGHEPLLNRGMNAAIAVRGDYAYIGSRTDAHDGTPHGGIMVVDISDPTAPRLRGRPFDMHAGESTRELRVWQSQDVLIVLNTNCGVGPTLHHCTQPSISNFRFYDIRGKNAAAPRLLNEFKVDTHEFFLWQDPRNPARALIFGRRRLDVRYARRRTQLPVLGLGHLADPHGEVPGDAVQRTARLQRGARAAADRRSALAHDQQRRPDGVLRAADRRLRGRRRVRVRRGRSVPDAALDHGQRAAPWAGPGAHSAIKLWGRDWAWVSDEVYGSATAPGHGCPWGWARMIDISNPQAPTVEAEYKVPENEPDTCTQWNPPLTSYSAHSPTLTPHVALSTWHSSGLQAVSIADPRHPYQLAQFSPEPLDAVMLEDPRLSSDPDTGRNEKVVMWSYPIVKDGLIYAIDLRNGLYVLTYRGPYEKEVQGIRFLEGNSNQGNALCYEPVGRVPSYCR